MNLGRTAIRRDAGPWLALWLTLGCASGCGGGGGGGTNPPAPLQADLAASPAAGPAPLWVQFTDLSTGAVTSWSWDFGDGATSGERNPRHLYALEGPYDVTLSVAAPLQSSAAHRAGLVQVGPPLQNALEFGMNPSFQRWSSREIVFADAMMRASEFMIVRGAELTQDPAPVFPLGRNPPRLGEGWPDLSALGPDETAGAWLFGAMEGSLPDGRVEPYVLTWEGTGSCQLVGTAVIGELRRVPRHVEVLVDPEIGGGKGTVGLWIDSSSRADPVRNVHVWLPGMAAVRPLFWPPYIERARALNLGRGPACWRTLDWTRVNDYGANDPPLPFEFDLAGTIRPTSPSQGTRRGMCPEFQVAFCNVVGSALHFQVPHRAEPMSPADYDTFLRDAFTRLRDGAPAVPGINGGAPFDGLAPGCGLTIELSNELWNAGFPAARWFQREAAARGVSLHQAIADELVHVWSLADEVFAGRRTVRRFIGGFVAESDFVQRILAALPPGTRVDALGPSCYFRPRPDVVDEWLVGASGDICPHCPTPEEVIAAARLSIEELRVKLAEHRAVADSYTNPDGSHPRLELYEAGQSFDAGFQPWGEAARAAQVLPEMYHAFVDDLIPMLVDSGVDTVDWYSFMTDQDPSHGVSVGFGIWNDMNQTITLPVPEPYRDEGAPKAAAIYRGPPQR